MEKQGASLTSPKFAVLVRVASAADKHGTPSAPGDRTLELCQTCGGFTLVCAPGGVPHESPQAGAKALFFSTVHGAFAHAHNGVKSWADAIRPHKISAGRCGLTNTPS